MNKSRRDEQAAYARMMRDLMADTRRFKEMDDVFTNDGSDSRPTPRGGRR